jgi:hypothetical protein
MVCKSHQGIATGGHKYCDCADIGRERSDGSTRCFDKCRTKEREEGEKWRWRWRCFDKCRAWSVSGAKAAAIVERKEKSEARRAELKKEDPIPEGFPDAAHRRELMLSSLEDAKIENESIDCILTDPPYPDLAISPPIEVKRRKQLIDGWYRWTAHRKMEAGERRGSSRAGYRAQCRAWPATFAGRQEKHGSAHLRDDAGKKSRLNRDHA